MVQEKLGSGGRKMESTIDVTGDGCLPQECMDKKDLGLLSSFMHTRAKETAEGQGMKVSLHVDCTKSGGASVVVGDAVEATRSAAATTSAAVALVLTSVTLDILRM